MTDQKIQETINRIDRAVAKTSASSTERALKRPRVVIKAKKHPNKGGWRGHPNSLRALEKHRGKTMFGNPNNRKRLCRKCNRVAIKGLDVCYSHGGAPTQIARRLADDCAGYSRPKTAHRLVQKLIEREELPQELLRQPIFLKISDILSVPYKEAKFRRRDRKPLSGSSKDEMNYLKTLTVLRLECVRAWLTMEISGDNGPWITAIGKARKLGIV